MYRYERYRHLHKDNKFTVTDAITHTHCTKKEFYLSSLVNFLMFFLIPSLIIHILLNHFFDAPLIFGVLFFICNLWIILSMIVNFIVMYINPKYAITYTTPGSILFGLKYANQLTGELLDSKFAKRNLFTFAYTRWKYNNNYEGLYLLLSETNQTPAMRDHGLIVVKKRIYEMFLEDYTENGNIKQALRIHLENEGYLSDNSNIFKD